MTYYTQGLIQRRDRDLTEFESSIGDAMGAAFDQAMFENPLSALRRIDEMDEAERGELVRGDPRQGMPDYRKPPDSQLLTQDRARGIVDESGLSIAIPEEGIREKALNIIMRNKREELKRQTILGSAPSGSAPLTLLSGFAASLLDPLSVASAFIPVVGEARYASMLANATTRGGRAVVRAQVGVLEGAVGAAMLEPIVLYASSRDQADYDMANSLLNVTFGTVMGGGLHAAGGLVSDWRKAKIAGRENEIGKPVEAVKPGPVSIKSYFEPDDLPTVLSKQIDQDRAFIQQTAFDRAAEKILPQIREELTELSRGKLPNVRDLKKEAENIEKQLSQDTYKAKAKAFQREGQSRKQAERSAREAVKRERQQLSERKAEIESSLDQNRSAEIARSHLSDIKKGEIPKAFQDRIQQEAQRISSGFTKNPLTDAISARTRIAALPRDVRINAAKSAIGQMVQGKNVDIESVVDPRETVLREQGQAPIRPDPKPEDDIASIESMLNDEQQLLGELSNQLGVKVDLSESDAVIKKADEYAKAWRAAAVCRLTN